MSKDDIAAKGLQCEEELASAGKRKWTGLAKWLLIVGLVMGGINVLVATRGEMIVALPSLVCIWGIYKFKRWGFYGIVAIRVFTIALALGVLALAEVRADSAWSSKGTQALFSEGWGLIWTWLVVRSRWKEMDPVFREKGAPG